MNIVLIGMRGAGKTTVAKKLAKILGKERIEIDDKISEKVGLPITEIVKQHGWDYFRKIESEVVEEVAALDDVIISTGGGVITNSNNTVALKRNGTVFFLQVSVKTLLYRTSNNSNRPSLTGKSPREDMEVILKQRIALYQGAADIIIDTEKNSATAVAALIVQQLGETV